VASETKFFAIVFQGNPHPRIAGLSAQLLVNWGNAHANFLHVRTAQPVQKMHLVKTREREKYDTPPAAQQRNNLLKKEKPGESRALTNVYFYQFTSRAWRSPRQPGDHFASLAIWCVRRDTFRLALFL
jgi:hypothetical protein